MTEFPPAVPDRVAPIAPGLMDAARRLRHLSEIGLALSAERDIRRLLAMILSTSRELTMADGGTLYIVEKAEGGEKKLFFRAAQNDSIIVDTNMSFAVSPSSLAGYVALTGEPLRFDDVYHLAPDAPYKFNPLFDLEHGYRTKSVLVVPLQNHNGEVIGVLQLINRKRRREVLLRDPKTVEREVVGFDEELAELAATLASQAAVALDNNLLLREIEALFESFVVASSSAIEDRDPCTSGHSQRVTTLTMELARAVSEAQEGPLKDVRFSPTQMRELRYAALLHDFGKIGVRENILTKSHKIDPAHFEAIKNRVLALRHQREALCAQRKIEFWQNKKLPREQIEFFCDELDHELELELRGLENDMALLEQCNDPAVLRTPDDLWAAQVAMLDRLSRLSYCDFSGETRCLLTPDERHALTVRRGSLTTEEYEQIQRHAQLSFDFLRRIPWTGALQNVPEIAYGHHERNDGSGYPRALKGDQIALQTQIMAIADVYDALTASDRPYKRSNTPEEALAILRMDTKAGKLNSDLLDLFVARGVYKTTTGAL